MVDLYGGLDPRPTQRRVMKCRKRFICVAGNRYPGKTTAAEWKIMDFCLANPGVEGFIGRWEKTRLYSTTIALWRKLFPVAEKGEEPTEWNGVYKFVPEDSLEPDFIKFKNGSLIHILNLQKHADKLRGGNFSFGLIDQMEETTPQVWTDAVGSTRAPVWMRDENPPYAYSLDKRGKKINLSDERRFIIATVNKTREWYWIRRLFKDHKTIDRKELAPNEALRYELIENPWDENKEAVEGGFYEDLKSSATSQADIMFQVYGEDPSEFGLVFPDLDRRTHGKRFEFSDLKDASYFIGYDEGFRPAPSAFLFMAITPDGTHWWRAAYKKSHTGIPQHKATLHEIANRIGFPLFPTSCRYVADPSVSGKMDGMGATIADQWGIRDWPWENGSRDEVAGLEIMRTLMQKDATGKTKWVMHEDDCEDFWDELGDASYDEERPGKILKRCVKHLIDTARYMVLKARAPYERVEPVNPDGKWTWNPTSKKVQLARKGLSWLAPERGEKTRLFVPRDERHSAP